MNITMHYCYDGRVPTEAGFYFCMFLGPLGDCHLGIARVELDIIEEELRWSEEMPCSFGGAPPYCYFTVGGTMDVNFMLALETLGKMIFTTQEQKNETETDK